MEAVPTGLRRAALEEILPLRQIGERPAQLDEARIPRGRGGVRRARSAGGAAVYGHDDEQWAAYGIARCLPEERVRNGPALRAGG